MATVYSRKTTGLFSNGAAQKKNNTDFGGYSYVTSDKLSGEGCFAVDYNVYGSTYVADEFVAVDTSKYYQFALSAKGTANNYEGNPPGGHLGFACYDESFNFIDLRNLKGIGDTTLTRAATPGDSSIYVANAGSWSLNASTAQRGLMLFGGDYPYSGGYSRYTVTANAYPTTGITDIGGGEWRIDLTSTLPTWTNALVGGVYPVGTYLSNGRAGGTYNYALGAPNHPPASGWITYTTAPFTGENRNSGLPFRYGTKYVRFLNLRNYNIRTATGGDGGRYLLDNILLFQLPDSTAIPTSFLSSDRIK